MTALDLSGCWALAEDRLRALVELDGVTPSDALLAATAAATAARSRPSGPSVAVLPLTGIITPAGGLLALLTGGHPAGLAGFRAQLAQAVADPNVGSVVLDIDSPGGLTDGTPETAALVRAAREHKPITAVANTTMGSAAYWIGSQADQIVASPSARVGSVGVYQVHTDSSGADEQQGRTITIVSAGAHKVDGNPHEALSDDGHNAMQRDVDDFYSMFVSDVARGRGVALPAFDGSAFGGGDAPIGARAVAAGLADRVGTLDEVLTAAGMSARVGVHARTEQQTLATVDDLIESLAQLW
jgi:capsid assembly protease